MRHVARLSTAGRAAVDFTLGITPPTVSRAGPRCHTDPMTPERSGPVADAWVAPPSLAAQLEAGRAARAEVPRERLANLPSGARDLMAILDAQDASRVPELVPIRTERMAASPFAFYRGTAALTRTVRSSGTPRPARRPSRVRTGSRRRRRWSRGTSVAGEAILEWSHAYAALSRADWELFRRHHGVA